MIRPLYYNMVRMRGARMIDDLLKLSVEKLVCRAQGRAMQEPDYTAAITTEFIPLMARHSRVLGNAKIGGSFIHQRPQATFVMNGNHETRELGDLLVLCRRTVQGRSIYNAALFQLKMASPAPYKMITNQGELAQLYLYTDWPQFRLTNGNDYDIYPKTVSQGAQYMFVTPNRWVIYTHSMPQAKMRNSTSLSFGRFIYDFVRWQNGRSIADEANKNSDEWSRLIWDILENNAKSCFKRKNVGLNQQQRNSTDYLNMLVGTENNANNNGGNVRHDVPQLEAIEDQPTCSLLFIDIIEDEER